MRRLIAQLICIARLLRDLFRDPLVANVQHLNRCYRRPAVPGSASRRAQP